MTVYLSTDARDQVNAAHDQLNRHALTLNGNVCTECGTEGPCPQRRAALRAIGRYGRLPRRRPGASRPERLPSRPGGGFGWFDQVASGPVS
jgi:hypothetical protein